MKKKNIIFIIVLVGLILVCGIVAICSNRKKETLDYAAVLENTAVTVDGNVLTVRDMAFYIAYEESEVEKQAVTYDSEDTGAYWNLHINGEFLKVSAREAAMNMAVHDEIFYRMAEEEGIVLSDEEKELLKEKQDDFWSDLSDEAKEKVLVSQDELNAAMEKIAVVQKYQMIYAEFQDKTYDDYEFNGDSYETLLASHEVVINDDIWNRLDYGNITLEHE